MINLVPGVQSTTAALTAERTRLDIIAQNVANANTTRGLDGKPYQRQEVVFDTLLNQQTQGQSTGNAQLSGPRVSRVIKDTRPFRAQYEPGHPEADRNGVVQYPNVNVYEEMADLIAAGRTFEANLAVLRTAKQMTQQTFSIGKR